MKQTPRFFSHGWARFLVGALALQSVGRGGGWGTAPNLPNRQLARNHVLLARSLCTLTPHDWSTTVNLTGVAWRGQPPPSHPHPPKSVWRATTIRRRHLWE